MHFYVSNKCGLLEEETEEQKLSQDNVKSTSSKEPRHNSQEKKKKKNSFLQNLSGFFFFQTNSSNATNTAVDQHKLGLCIMCLDIYTCIKTIPLNFRNFPVESKPSQKKNSICLSDGDKCCSVNFTKRKKKSKLTVIST